MRTIFIAIAAALSVSACKQKENQFDASGTFEASEVIVSSELSGKILSFTINEGDTVSANRIVGTVDAENIVLQKEQVEASISSLNDRTADAGPQVQLLQNQLAVQQSQLNNLLLEND